MSPCFLNSAFLRKPEGMFRVAGFNRRRAKQLSAAEVKWELRRKVTGGGQTLIPTMSFYTPQVLSGVCMSVLDYVNAR